MNLFSLTLILALLLIGFPDSLAAADTEKKPIATTSAAEKKERKSTNGKKKKSRKPAPADLNTTPFVPADASEFPGETDRLDIFLLIGQSNMKGRGVMPAEPLNDPQIILLHKRTDEWFHARDPLHHVGDPKDFSESDNAGVGPGLTFAQSLIKEHPTTRIALIPCAVGGSPIRSWKKGARFYDDTIRRAKLALEQGPKDKTRIAGALWLQGESDSQSAEKIAAYPAALDQLVTHLRNDTGVPDLPFIACTIGELKPESRKSRAAINKILLSLPERVPHTKCVDSRAFAKDIGDGVHFDTSTQEKHGELFAAEYLGMAEQEDES